MSICSLDSLVFIVFSEKIRFDVSIESSARQRIHMKNQALFSSEDKSKKLICRLLHFLFGPLSVKSRHPWKREAKMKMAELLPLKMYVYTLKRFLQVQASVKDIIGPQYHTDKFEDRSDYLCRQCSSRGIYTS